MRYPFLRRIVCFQLFVIVILCFVQPGYAEEQILAHVIASGAANDNVRTIIFFTNPSMSMAAGMGELFRPDGTPLLLSIDGSALSATFPWSVAPMGTGRVTLTSSNPSAEVGWLKITTEGRTAVTVSAVVQHVEGGNVVSQASILSSLRQLSSTFVHDSIGPADDTSVSVVNPHNMENTITFELFDANGQFLGNTDRTLPANFSFSGLVSELFREIPGINELEGLVNITGSLPFASSALHASGQAMRTVPMTPGPIERFGFEDGTSQGWIPQIFPGSQAITACMASDERPFLGRFALRCSVDLACESPDRPQGEAFVDLRASPVRMRTMAPVNLEGVPMTARVCAPSEAAGESQRPNGWQFFVKDTEFRGFFGRFTNIRAGWMTIGTTPGRTAPVGGHMDPGFEPTQIIIVGVKIGCGGGSQDTFSGSIDIDMVAW